MRCPVSLPPRWSTAIPRTCNGFSTKRRHPRMAQGSTKPADTSATSVAEGLTRTQREDATMARHPPGHSPSLRRFSDRGCQTAQLLRAHHQPYQALHAFRVQGDAGGHASALTDLVDGVAEALRVVRV